MVTVNVKTQGDDADIVLTIEADSYLPLLLKLNLWNKLRAAWLILRGRELRISGPLEWQLKGKVGIPPEQVTKSFEAARAADRILSLERRPAEPIACEHGVRPFTNCIICFS